MILNVEILDDMLFEAYCAGYYDAADYHHLNTSPLERDFRNWLTEIAGYDLKALLQEELS